jgi:hypothetical protein
MADDLRAFWIDHDYDRNHAGDSRYAAYVRDRMPRFAETWDPDAWDDGTVPFACLAWEVANSPVMAPGYVRTHSRVLSGQVVRNDWDGSLGADVSLIIPQPAPLRHLRAAGLGCNWRDWRSEYRFSGEYYDYPSGEDVTQRPYLMCSARLCFPLPAAMTVLAKPGPVFAKPGVTEHFAAETVAVLVDEMNRIVGPVLAKIEES